MKSKFADLQLTLVAIIWGTGFAASQIALDEGLTPYQVLTFRFFISAVVLGVIFYRQLIKARLPELKAGGIIGVFLFVAFAFQITGLQHTTPSKNAFLTATNVVMVPFLYWVISKKRPDGYSFSGAVLTVIGVSFLTLNGSLALGLGDFLTLMCALCFAFHIIAVGHYAKKYSPIVLTAVQMAVAFLFSLIFTVFADGVPEVTYKGGAAVIYLGLFSTTIAFLLQNLAQKYTTETKAAIIMSTEAVFGSLFSVLMLGEIFNLKMILGCAIIFVAIILAETKLEFLQKYKSW